MVPLRLLDPDTKANASTSVVFPQAPCPTTATFRISSALYSFITAFLADEERCPPAAAWPGQESYEFVIGKSWRIVLATKTEYWAGEFANRFVLAKIKVWTNGKHLWTRTIGSTVIGQGLDSLIFYPLAFYGLAGWPIEQLWQVVLSQWLI